MRGYNEAEVDEFLDMIIKDYEAFTQEIKRLKQENNRYKKNMEQPSTRASQNSHQVNYDVLKRLSNLEKEVRSEEHTSELQSRFDLVCRLLLEKKKRVLLVGAV